MKRQFLLKKCNLILKIQACLKGTDCEYTASSLSCNDQQVDHCEDNHYDSTVKCLSFHIIGSSKEFQVHLNVSRKSLCQDLYKEVEKQTNIPQKLQLLSFRQHIIDPQSPVCGYNFSDENSVYMSVKGLGGGPTDDGNFKSLCI